MNLDSREAVTALDPMGMLRHFEELPAQCREALSIAQSVSLSPLTSQPRIAGLTGMGGSAVGGDFVRALFDEEGPCPFLVNRDYTLPHFFGKGDLLFCASYSGNTEETLNSFEQGHSRGAQIIVVTSGGKLADLAIQHGYPLFKMPGGFPPRAALGYMLIPLIYACEKLGLICTQHYEKAFKLLEACGEDWGVARSGASNEAKKLALAAHGNVCLLYGLGSWQGIVANRWKGQFNENSKNLAFPNSYPELNHNEVLGWVKADGQGVKQWVGILLEDGNESAKMKARARVTMDLTKDRCDWHTARARGESLLERMLSLAHLADYVSVYLAALNSVDPENIDWINVLKGELAKVP